MKLKLRKKWPIVIIILFFAFVAVFYVFRLKVNFSESMPVGLYQEKTVGQLKRGNFVIVCLPRKIEEFGKKRFYILGGTCRGDFSPVVKELIALPGDNVVLTNKGMVVNGFDYLAPASAKDTKGRTLSKIPRGVYNNTDGFWVYGENSPALSWDSRYYGAVQRQNIIGVAKPVFVFK